MEIKSEWTYPVSVGYKLYSSSRDAKVDEEKDGATFEFNFKYGESWDTSVVTAATLTAIASTLALLIF